MLHLLDSNILIYGSKPEHAFLLPFIFGRDSRVSAASIAEVLGYTGLTDEDSTLFEKWFAEIFFEEVSQVVLRRAAKLRQARRMKLGDAIVAGTALEIGAAVVTRNVEDYQNIPGLKVLDPFLAHDRC